MDIHPHWKQIKQLFKRSFKSSFHFSIATLNDKGEPHITPIGSLILGQPGQAIFFEEFTTGIEKNRVNNPNICVMAVDSSKWLWLKSLVSGRFEQAPAVRLYGVLGEKRDATETEIKLWQRRVRVLRFTKGHSILWSNMKTVREIHFNRMETVNIGPMTRTNWA